MNIPFEGWDNLSLLRKSALTLFFIMWLAFSSEVVIATRENVVLTVVSLCFLWLGFLVISSIVTTFDNDF
jgi:hypothetical protein